MIFKNLLKEAIQEARLGGGGNVHLAALYTFPLDVNRQTTRLQDYKFILKISTCVINAQCMQLLSRIFQDISRAIESQYLNITQDFGVCIGMTC